MQATIQNSIQNVTYTDSQTHGNYACGIVANTEGAQVQCSPVPMKGAVLAGMGAVYGLESHSVTHVLIQVVAALLGEAIFCKEHHCILVLPLSLKKFSKQLDTALKMQVVPSNDAKFNVHNLPLIASALVLTLAGER